MIDIQRAPATAAWKLSKPATTCHHEFEKRLQKSHLREPVQKSASSYVLIPFTSAIWRACRESKCVQRTEISAGKESKCYESNCEAEGRLQPLDVLLSRQPQLRLSGLCTELETTENFPHRGNHISLKSGVSLHTPCEVHEMCLSGSKFERH
jgi:hypothetical protein